MRPPAELPGMPHLQCRMRRWRESHHLSHLLYLLHFRRQLHHAEPGHCRHH